MKNTLSAGARIALLRRALQARPGSANLLCQLSEALAEIGEHREAADLLRRAYVLQPHACTIVRESDLDRHEAAKLRDYASAMIEHGVAYSLVIAALAIGEARLGNRAAVERLVDYRRLTRDFIMAPPDGYDQASFNQALAAEIRSDLTFYDAPPSKAIRRAWRRDGVLESSQTATRAWVQSIRREVDRYIAGLPQDLDHPFLASRPTEYVLGAWAVVSDGEGHHLPHIHPRAWLSGVFYVVRPAASLDPDSRCGWLQVGPPEKYGVSAAHGWDARAIAPEPGRLVLLPGYFFHRTYPMGVNEERVCIAFDVMPAELADENSSTTDHHDAVPAGA
jgi:hypothetical protein